MNGYTFTTEVRQSLTQAREEAARLHHEWVGTEHILLGLIVRSDQPAARLLASIAVDVGELRARIESVVKQGSATHRGPDLPYTSRAKKSLELAMSAARELNHTWVGADHLLLGLLREEKGIGAQMLSTVFGVTPEAVQPFVGKFDDGTSLYVPQQPVAFEVEHTTRTFTYPERPNMMFAFPLPLPGPLPVLPKVLLAIGLVALVVSRIGAVEPGTWVMEVFPIFLGVPLLILTARRFPLTPLAYWLIFVHALILMLGGHYTYAKVPLGFWIENAFHFSRNHYDRIGHFAQGFIPAIIAREILIRRSPLRPGKWLFFVVTCICLSLSACYEFVEWLAAVTGGSSADAFLGTQGDVWDTQWDMLLALIGALVAQLTLSRSHNRQLWRLANRHAVSLD